MKVKGDGRCHCLPSSLQSSRGLLALADPISAAGGWYVLVRLECFLVEIWWEMRKQSDGCYRG